MKCNNCIHYRICQDIECLAEDEHCNGYEDKRNFIKLPCKVGDMVYDISFGEINEYKIIAFDLYSEIEIAICEIDYEDRFGFDFHRFGETIFLTREAAEQALKEHE